MSAYVFFYWSRQLILFILSIVFGAFGIHTLIQAYHLANPLEFIMTFFSSSLMILISIVGLIYPSIKVFTAWRKR